MRRRGRTAVMLVTLAFVFAPALRGDDAERILTVDHFVPVRSTVPAIEGQQVPIYVRERVAAGTALRGGAGANHVALFVHGAGTPAEVAFDVPYQDYSWMAYLAQAGFDVFAMDVTGYGRSTRPPLMSDPCSLSSSQQAALSSELLSIRCTGSYPDHLTTL